VFGGGGALAVGRMHLGVEYAQGTMGPRGEGVLARSLVDARLDLGVRIAEWLTAQVGAHARGRATSDGAVGGVERWLWGEARARVSTPIVGRAVLGELAFWRAVALGMNVPQGGGSGQGGEAGLRLQLPGHPVWFRITYAVDQIRVSAVGRRDTLDGVTLVTGVSFR
jgi:hypothetical protein